MGDLLVREVMEPTVDGEISSPEETVGKLTNRMVRGGIGEIFLLSGKRYVGMVTMRYLMRRRALPLHTKADHVAVNHPALSATDSLAHAAEQLLATGERVLPVVKSDRLIGKLTRDAVVRVIAETPRLSQGTVAEVMTPSPEVVREDDNVEHARHIILQFGEEAVPVVDSDGKFSGVVTMQEIVRRTEHPEKHRGRAVGERAPSSVTVSSVMRLDAPTVKLGSPVKDAIEAMNRSGLRFVVVAQERKVMGVISDADLVELLVRDRPRDQCYVQITGVSGEDMWTLDSIYSVIEKRLKQLTKFAEPTMVALHVVKYYESGNRPKYSLRLRLTTTKSTLHENTSGWDAAAAVDDAMLTLEKRIKKEHERRVDAKTRGRRA